MKKPIRILMSLVAAMACEPVAFAKVHYVSPSGEDRAGGGSEEAPFASPGYALAQAASGDEVRVLEGVYTFDETPEIKSDNITLRGWNAAREKVVFDARGQRRCLQADAQADGTLNLRKNVSVIGITFRNGRQDVTPTATSWKGAGAGVMLAAEASSWPTAGNHVVSNCVFEGCVNVQSPGGGLCVAPGSTVVDCLFTNNLVCADVPRQNTSGVQGGGAGAFSPIVSNETTFRDCIFVDNVATNGAAALGAGSTQSSYLQTQTGGLVVRGCRFLRNVGVSANTSAVRASGCLPQRAWEVVDCTFVSNRLEGAGGGGAVYAGTALDTTGTKLPSSARTNTFTRCAFAFNEARESSSAAIVYQGMKSPLVLASCAFVTNTGVSAAALYSVGRLAATECLFEGNVVRTDKNMWGGLVCSEGIDSAFMRCDFVGNTVNGHMGALSVRGDTSVIDCRFLRNNRTNEADPQSAYGCLRILGVNAHVRNCLFAANQNAIQGAAIGISATGAMVENCTFVGNRSKEYVRSDFSGVAISMATALTGVVVRNCLFVDNRNGRGVEGVPQVSAVFRGDAAGSIGYCWADTDVLPIEAGNGNLAVGDGNPRWSSRFPGEYRPGARTPGRDRGFAAEWTVGAKDYFGNRRNSGSGVDFGYAEYQERGLAVIVR